MDALLAALAVFVGSHLLMSSDWLRPLLIRRLGTNGFRITYSLVAAGTLIWSVVSYGNAPFELLFTPPAWAPMLAAATMPVAFILLVAAVSTPSVTMVGQDGLARDPKPVRGIATITRHPMLCAFVLWAAVHILANGDLASCLFFGAMGLLSLIGMWDIDHRRLRSLGADWGPVALTSSVIPFLAAIQGRTRIDWAGIGWIRPLVGLALYGAMVMAHEWLFGVSPMPHGG